MTTVKTLKFHTLHGEAHEEGSTYDVDDQDVSNLVAQGMACPVNAPAAPESRPSHPVSPMTFTE